MSIFHKVLIKTKWHVHVMLSTALAYIGTPYIGHLGRCADKAHVTTSLCSDVHCRELYSDL